MFLARYLPQDSGIKSMTSIISQLHNDFIDWRLNQHDIERMNNKSKMKTKTDSEMLDVVKLWGRI